MLVTIFLFVYNFVLQDKEKNYVQINMAKLWTIEWRTSFMKIRISCQFRTRILIHRFNGIREIRLPVWQRSRELYFTDSG